MEIERIPGAMFYFGAPQGWNPETDPPCDCLPCKPQQIGNRIFMVSQWRPNAEEIAKIVEGQPIYLWVHGMKHPVVALSVAGIDNLSHNSDAPQQEGNNDAERFPNPGAAEIGEMG